MRAGETAPVRAIGVDIGGAGAPLRFGICDFTTPDLDLETELRLYRSVGATAIAPVEQKLRAEGLDRARRLLERSGLAVTAGMPAMVSLLPHATYSPQPADLASRLASFREAVALFSAVDARSMNCIAGTFDPEDLSGSRRRMVTALRQVCDLGAESGLRIGYEIVRSPSITTVPEAVELLAEVDHPNLGVVLDPWHLWDTPGYPEVVRSLPSTPVSVHLSDSRLEPRSLQDRRLPGEGEGRLPELIRLVRELGYTGWYELEVVSDDGRFGHAFEDSLWRLPPEELLTRGRLGFEAAWAESVSTAAE